MKSRGLGRTFQRGNVWWIAYHWRGKEHRESTRSEKEADARRLLKKRIGEMGRGRLVGPTEERVTFEDLADDYVRERKINGRGERAVDYVEDRVAHLKRFFGMDRAVDITTPRVRAFIEARLGEGASHGTINRDLAALSRMFTLAVEAERLTSRPHIPKLKESAPREGFFEHPEYLAVREHLEPDFQDVLDFGYFCGWRIGEVARLEWRDVDRTAGVIRLRPELSKNSDGRKLVLSEPLRQVIERRWKARDLACPFVFHHDGARLYHRGSMSRAWKVAWKAAREAAGLEGRIFHDLRRTVVRNLVRSGTPESVAMKVTGHKTRAILDRYDVTSEKDIEQATERLAEFVSCQPTEPTVQPLPRRVNEGA